MKKAAINEAANELGFNKVAFAHHADDAIETLFMNEMYGGRIATFAPKMHLEKANMGFIRPFTYVREKDIIKLIKEEKLPVISSKCPADKFTKREDVKRLLLTGSQEEFLDCLDFAPEGVLNLVKTLAVDLEINDLAKREAIFKKTGFNVTKAVEINRQSQEEEEVETVKQRRAAAPTTTVTEPKATGRRTTPKYSVKA
jgi:tRNA(Ile)-lysidine synthase TilS/MesJ